MGKVGGGKGTVIVDQPGGSASAEWRRARHAAAEHRQSVKAALALVVATVVAMAGWATGATKGHGPVVVGVVATSLVAAGAAVADWLRTPPDPDRWHRGAEGEMATARLLERLPRRYVVFHDRRQPGTRGNLDHVVIGPSGVWVVDSKARRARLHVHRGQVWAGRHPIEVAPVAIQAARVEQALGVAVSGIVAVHGLGLRRRGKVVDGVRIVPARRLLRRLRRGRRLQRDDVVALARRVDLLFPRYQ